MRKYSRQLLLILALGLLQSPWVHALGFGELKLNSGLNQPLDAEIPLYDTGTLNASQLLVKLASPDAFERLGVERFFFLTRLKFTVALDGRGAGVIQVTSREPVREPYLDFIIEAHWPNGRIQREYTVLLDIPKYSDRAAAPVQVSRRPAGDASSATAPRTQTIPARSSRGPRPRQGDDRRSLPSVDGENRYRVQHNDTLVDIARRARPSRDVSIEQVMLALQRNNPRAFIGGNVNRLKSGYVLTYPTAAEARRLTASEAQDEVARQTAVWRGRPAPSQPQYALRDAPAESGSQNATAGAATAYETSGSAEPRGRLSIAAGEGSGEGVGDGSVENLSLRDQLAASQENLDRIARQNSELKGRLQDMERQLQTLQRLLELKDEQLAALQAGIGASADDTDGPDDGAKPDDETVAQDKAGPQPEPELPLWREILAAGQSLVTQAWDAGDKALQDMGVEPAALRTAVLLIPLLLLLWLLVRAARSGTARVSNEEEEAAPVVNPVPVAAAAAAEAEQAQDQSLADATETLEAEASSKEEPDTVSVEPEAEAESAAPAVEVPANKGINANEAVAEAGMYITYRHFEQAKGLLNAALKQHPEHPGLLEKQAELAIEQQDQSSFDAARSTLVTLGAQRELERLDDQLELRDFGADWGYSHSTDVGAQPEAGEDLASAEQQELENEFDDLQAPEAGSDLKQSPLSLVGDPSDAEALDEPTGAATVEQGAESDTTIVEFTGGMLNAEDQSQQDAQTVADTNDETSNEAGAESSPETLPETKDAADDFEFDLDLSDLELDEEPSQSDSSDAAAVASKTEPESEPGTQTDEEDGPSFSFDEPLDSGDDDPTFGDLDFDLEDRFDRVGDFSALDKDDDDSEPGKDDKEQDLGQQLEPAALFDDLDDDGVSLLSEEDDVTQKLNLARAYIELGESHSARDMLNEVLADGDEEQREQAQQLLAKL